MRAVLTGGACAAVHSRGAYHSLDIDFIVTGAATQTQLDGAMATAGFSRRGDRYVHRHTRFYVEFPRGPVAIGGDYRIEPVEHRRPGRRFLMLSPTDCCRDRLAAYYHWNDRQSLAVAAAVARRHPVDLDAIRRWSVAEGFPDRFDDFVAEIRRGGRRRS